MPIIPNKIAVVITSTILALQSACSSVPTTDSRDPYENWNRKVQSFNDVADDYILKPVANGYKWAMPDFAQRGVTNFFSNIDEIGVIINGALLGKFSQAGNDFARLLVNTTAGVAGFVDVASEIDLPKHEENFDKTLSEWGVDTGPYLVFPLFGSSSLRGVGGAVGNLALDPTTFLVFPATASAGLGVTNVISKRAENLGMEKIVNETGIDHYEFFKNAYFSRQSGDDDIQNSEALE